MALFGKQFFKSKSNSVEEAYRSGVYALERQEFSNAHSHFIIAAEQGHGSAFYNLFSIHGGGCLSPYKVDYAAQCWQKAADLGHQVAKQQLFMLEAADRGGFGFDNLVRFASLPSAPGFLSAFLMTSACRFVHTICNKHDAVDDIVAYELDAAMTSDDWRAKSFVKRTGVSPDFFQGGLYNLEGGSAADQISGGLNNFSLALIQNGIDRELCMMARCTIIGYLIMKSSLGSQSEPLLGVRAFLAAK